MNDVFTAVWFLMMMSNIYFLSHSQEHCIIEIRDSRRTVCLKTLPEICGVFSVVWCLHFLKDMCWWLTPLCMLSDTTADIISCFMAHCWWFSYKTNLMNGWHFFSLDQNHPILGQLKTESSQCEKSGTNLVPSIIGPRIKNMIHCNVSIPAMEGSIS